MRNAAAPHCPPLTRPHNKRYVQVPAAACDALRTRLRSGWRRAR